MVERSETICERSEQHSAGASKKSARSADLFASYDEIQQQGLKKHDIVAVPFDKDTGFFDVKIGL